MATTIDLQSELAIFQLLEDDLKALSLKEAAEKIQLDEVLTSTGPRTEPVYSVVDSLSDGKIALSLVVADAQIARDQAYAESLQSQEASLAVSRQYAQRLAAAEQKFRIDSEFAKRLQDREDTTDGCDADSVLGREIIDAIFASDPNEKGKGKGRLSTPTDDLLLSVDGPTGSTSSDPDDSTSKGLAHVYPICGICGDAFQNTHSPVSASLSANSSTRLPFGLSLPCPSQHSYCVNCLSLYIISKLDPDGTGGAPNEQKIFPIRCPECPLDQWTEGVQDDVAERILTKDRITLWHHRKLLDSLPRYYCPNRQCSTLVLLHEDPGEPQATCPLCTTVMCVPCKTQWHTDLTCEEYQALPLDERSPEDQLLIQLAKERKWRRCDCGIMIDLAFGCNHMTCHCGRHFCFKCGAAWDMEAYKCSRGAGCELWEDDDMLLEEDQRQGGVDAQQPLAQEAIAPPPIFHVPEVAPLRHQEQRVIRDFDWIEDEGVVVSKHTFTFGMIQRINCGYCGSTFVSLAGLRHHLANIRRHPIYSCCGKFFRLREHYLQHQSASWPHHHTCVRGDDEI